MLRATRTQAPCADLRARREFHALRLAVEIEVAVERRRGVAHLARAAYRHAAGAAHIEGVFGSRVALVGELAIAFCTRVAEHLRRIVRLLLADAARVDDRAGLGPEGAEAFGVDGDGELPVAGLDGVGVSDRR